MEISFGAKQRLYEYLKSTDTDFLSERGQNRNYHRFDFLNQVWNLKEIPSTDNRFDDAEGDIWQHMINNEDWDIDYLFLDRLNLLEDDEKFNLFLEQIVSPQFRKDEEEITSIVSIINNELQGEDVVLAIDDYNERGVPIYILTIRKDIEELPIDIKLNKIIFIVEGKEGSEMLLKNTKQYFYLRSDNWDDYTSKTSFELKYFNGKWLSFGDIKIMHRNVDFKSTWETLDSSFFNLSTHYCSLGQSDVFYKNLKEIFQNDFESILYALKDSAFFPGILEQFEHLTRFRKSLLRSDYAEKILRTIRYELLGYDISSFYRFTYFFKPPYSQKAIDINFNFNDEDPLPERIYAIIGKNGAGKTQLLSSLPVNISRRNKEFFSPHVPIFSKVITVSYSAFDRFEIPVKSSRFNYVYCGLKDENGEYMSERVLLNRFFITTQKISEYQRVDKWREILLNFIDKQWINEFVIEKQILQFGDYYTIDNESFKRIKNNLSSGQSILLYIISEITANIRFNSLLLYDEPETHLHPNAISQLINTIYELVNEFQSFCIIGTHSPIVIQEILSKNVYVIEKEESVASVRKIGFESFGESLSTLTEEVFGNKEVPKQYKKIIDYQVAKGKSFEEIVSLLEDENVPLSLNAKLYVKSRTKE